MNITRVIHQNTTFTKCTLFTCVFSSHLIMSILIYKRKTFIWRCKIFGKNFAAESCVKGKWITSLRQVWDTYDVLSLIRHEMQVKTSLLVCARNRLDDNSVSNNSILLLASYTCQKASFVECHLKLTLEVCMKSSILIWKSCWSHCKEFIHAYAIIIFFVINLPVKQLSLVMDAKPLQSLSLLKAHLFLTIDGKLAFRSTTSQSTTNE